MMMRFALACFVAACGGPQEPPPPSNASSNEDAACRAQAAELGRWMRDLWDGKPVAAPWATGDADFDAHVATLRAELRPTPGSATKMRGIPAGPGPLDLELASCPAAGAQLANVGNAETSQQKIDAWTGIADAIGTCECRPRIPRLKVYFHILVRGPD